ncbi:MAG: TolC family protein [Rhodocyclales bacterium]|nr:TolC family protein [Rhodocyclales bacterium]
MRPFAFIVVLLPLLAPSAQAQTLRDAVDAAWARQPAAQALTARQDEFAARRDAADSLLSGAPAATLANRNDRLQRHTGQSEWEAGIALPLWLPGYQARTLALIERERESFAALVEEARWRLAGEVRESWWQTRLAANERELAARRADAALQLVADVDRRVRAGDLPRIDLNQARAAEAAADAALAEADARAHRAARAFLALTGHPELPSPAGMEETRREADPGAAHPRLAPLERAIAAARARLQVASRNVRDLPELAFGLRRERALDGAAWENSTSVEIRIPLATDARNRPRIAAANAELIEAEAQLPYEQARIEAERDAAGHELARAAEAAGRAETRRALAAETQREYARAFALGNIDLPQRLRIEADSFDAELAAARARIEAARAVSRYHQAIGVLP